MSGPIVRSAPSKKFTSNWESVFGNKSQATEKAKGGAKPATKTPAKATAKKKKK